MKKILVTFIFLVLSFNVLCALDLSEFENKMKTISEKEIDEGDKIIELRKLLSEVIAIKSFIYNPTSEFFVKDVGKDRKNAIKTIDNLLDKINKEIIHLSNVYKRFRTEKKGTAQSIVNHLNEIDDFLVQKPLRMLMTITSLDSLVGEEEVPQLDNNGNIVTETKTKQVPETDTDGTVLTDEKGNPKMKTEEYKVNKMIKQSKKLKIKVGSEEKEIENPLKTLGIIKVKEITKNIGISVVGMFILFSFLNRAIDIDKFDYWCLLPITIKGGIVVAFIISSDTILLFFNSLAETIAQSLISSEGVAIVGIINIQDTNILMLVIIFLISFISLVLFSGVILFLLAKTLFRLVKILIMSIFLPIYLSLFSFERTSDIGKGYVKTLFITNLELILIYVLILFFGSINQFVSSLMATTSGGVGTGYLVACLTNIIEAMIMIVLITSYDKLVDSVGV